jgi:hypothetical protein
MSHGNITSWVKKVGDAVAAGDVLCEMETDKASISWESQDEGFLARVLLGDGSQDIPVGPGAGGRPGGRWAGSQPPGWRCAECSATLLRQRTRCAAGR